MKKPIQLKDLIHISRKFMLALAMLLLGLLGGLVAPSVRTIFEKQTVPFVSTDKNEGATLKIGWIGPLSGPVSFLGQENLNVIRLMIDEHNNARNGNQAEIEFFAEDDGYNAIISLEKYNEIVNKRGVDAVFVSTYSALFPIAQQASSDGVIIIDPIDNDRYLSMLSRNVFLIAKRSEELGEALADDLKLHNHKNVVIYFYSADDFMPSVAFGLQEKLKKQNTITLVRPYISIDSEELNAELSLAQKIAPDAFVFLGYPETGLLMKEIRGKGLKGMFYAINTTAATTSEGALEGSRLLQFTQADASNPSTQDFLIRYQEKYPGEIAHPWTVFQAHDAVSILLKIIKETDSSRISVDSLRKSLLQTRDFAGLSGTININEQGSSEGIYWHMYNFENGKLVK